jgi:hypothetical protein
MSRRSVLLPSSGSKRAKNAAYVLLVVYFASTFLRYDDNILSDYTASHPTHPYSISASATLVLRLLPFDDAIQSGRTLSKGSEEHTFSIVRVEG